MGAVFIDTLCFRPSGKRPLMMIDVGIEFVNSSAGTNARTSVLLSIRIPTLLAYLLLRM